MSIQGFAISDTRWYTLKSLLMRKIFWILTRNSPPLYLKGDDRITASPMTMATHERPVTLLLRALADAGYRDALFDVGANVGLASFFVHDRFRRVFCFEPNPHVFHALEANLAPVSTVDHPVTLYPFGLGDESGILDLMVPPHNFGGAFITSPANALTPIELAAKEGQASYDESRFLRVPVRIERGRKVLSTLFADLPHDAAITVKIDVEGFEPTVLREIAAALPPHIRAALLFENWSDSFDPVAFFADTFVGRNGQILKLESSLDTPSRHGRNLTLIMRGDRHRLVSAPLHWKGEILFLVDADPVANT